jgi:type IV secretion system protein VirB9
MSRIILISLATASALAGCAGAQAQAQPIADKSSMEIAATPAPTPQPPVTIVTIPEPLPLPGQLKPIETAAMPKGLSDPRHRVRAANAAARIEPAETGFLNAIQHYPWADGALYQVYTAPGEVTDIALQEGEQLVGPGPVAAGDTVRWIIGDTVSGTGAKTKVHILVKPTRADLATNMVINTDRRTYHLELRAAQTTYMASVSWTYPQDQLIALRAANAAASAAAPIAAGIDLSALNFRYRIEGDKTSWRPVRAFDDGRQVFVEFPTSIAQGEMPPLFVTGASGGAELINYRVQGRYMLVDSLFAAAELRLGNRKTERRVRIVRDNGKGRR